ncbi:MAG: sigma 54-interacting transcriptional regulator [Desulfobacteraceae bacterium]|nr:sigma 54-interacting transcriptional regulator [Desulfobacteraceae bacterium]MDH3721854.1 sigma 54-interacting transcriptional regulator [Desulfobacteraceae bacterium]MDH3874875.1 sigma 54-interacting transcriptional regulator [Desulfobacteraceae bacterium]
MPNYDEQFLTRVFDSVSDPFAIYDHDFRILRVNRALRTLFRISAEKIIGKYCYAVFYKQKAVCKGCHVQEVFLTGEPQIREKHIPTPDENDRIFEIYSCPIKDQQGEVMEVVEYIRDITERKSLESQLLASKEFNEKVINSITDSLIVLDPVAYTIIQANESFYFRVGKNQTEIIGKKCYEIMLGRQTFCGESGIQCPIEETVRSKSPAISDKIYPDTDGKDRVLQIATYPIFDNQGDISSIIRLERDVTEKRKMADALAFRSRELQRAQNQLERLFKISRQVNAKNALSEIVDFAHEVTREIFPDAVPLIFLLDAGGQNLLSLEGCNPTVLEPLLRAQQEIERSGLISDFIQYLQSTREPRVVGSTYNNDIPNFLKIISKGCPNWFGFPISAPQQPIGYFVLKSSTSHKFSHEDIHFFLTLFNQIAGHVRYLVIHETEINHLRQRVAERTFHGKIIGQSDEMQKVYKLIDLVSTSDATVLITGENGTGKELVAQAIHRQGHRKEGAFVVANCSAYSPALLESELFGHEKGAFTGAIKRKIGRVERAQGGILFLDEIGDIAPATQVLLLRFLQDHCFERVGGEETMEADVRVLAATNRNLYKEVEVGRFRNDLYYRLNVITLHLPPLRDRKEDIPSLCNHFLEKYSLKENKDIKSFSPGAMQIFMDHEWPGNVRQLENAVSHAVILTQGQFIERRHLPQFLRQSVPEPSTTCLAENERRLIFNVLKESDWNKHEASRRLKISRSTLYSKIRRHHINKETV